jgi:hypothetical protein
MSTARANPVYDTLVIVTASLATEIGLGDDAGHLVPKAVGALRTSLVPGASGVVCGLDTPPSPIQLPQASRYSQTEREAGLLCSRPMPQLPPAEGSAQVGCTSSGALVTGAPPRPISGWSRRGNPRGSPTAFGCTTVKVEENQPSPV